MGRKGEEKALEEVLTRKMVGVGRGEEWLRKGKCWGWSWGEGRKNRY